MRFFLWMVVVFAAGVLQSEEFVAPEKAPSTRNEDLKFLLHHTFLTENCDSLLHLMAGEAIAASEKAIDSEELIQKFRDSLNEEKTLAPFFAPYASFSDQEIHDLRKIHEIAVYQKFMKEGVQIFKQNFDSMKENFKDLVEENGKAIAANTQVVEITAANFHKEIGSAKPVILDVYATWCGACKSMEPIFRELSAQYKDSIRFAKINYDTEPEPVKKYNVTALPTFLFFRAGKDDPVKKIVGGMSKAEFEAQIAQFLGLENPVSSPPKKK